MLDRPAQAALESTGMMDNTMERTLILVKPDAVQRQLIGRILTRFEDKGLKIVGLKLLQISAETAAEMYAEHQGKEFYEPLVEFMTSAPTVAVVLEGLHAVGIVRRFVGPTFGPEAPPGTVRGDFGTSGRYNLVHASDSPESARREIALFFPRQELWDYPLIISRWVHAEHHGKLI